MRFVTLSRLGLILIAVLLASCHRGEAKKNATETLPVDQMYSVAKAALEDGNLSKAIQYDQRPIARFPFGAYTEQATLDLAYAQYKSDKREDAYSTINRFIKTYPAQKHVDYAYYLRGVINFDRDRGFLDRYANQEVSYLLQRIEDFPGVVILSSNLRGNIDDAFTRRFQSVIAFPMPQAEERYRLWTESVPVLLERDVDLYFVRLAEKHEISGGTIIKDAEALKKAGAQAVWVAATHGVFSSGAIEKIEQSPIDRVFVTDSFMHPPEDIARSKKIEVVSCAELFAQAIRRTNQGESLSELILT